MASRTYVFAQPGDDLVAIAARELPGVDGADQQLLSWNLHLAARAGLGRSVGLLASDIVFTEPPLASTASATASATTATSAPNQVTTRTAAAESA